jgi:hypothetical protein
VRLALPLEVQLAARELQVGPAIAALDQQFPVLDFPGGGVLARDVLLLRIELGGTGAVEQDDGVGGRPARPTRRSDDRRSGTRDIVDLPLGARDQRRVIVADRMGLVVGGGPKGGQREAEGKEQVGLHKQRRQHGRDWRILHDGNQPAAAWASPLCKPRSSASPRSRPING